LENTFRARNFDGVHNKDHKVRYKGSSLNIRNYDVLTFALRVYRTE